MPPAPALTKHCLGLPDQAVRAIGRCAVTLERAAERCINVLLELIKQKVNYVVQESIVVIKDIFRRYPNRCARVRGAS
jgi:vesicle coat complex subunit